MLIKSQTEDPVEEDHGTGQEEVDLAHVKDQDQPAVKPGAKSDTNQLDSPPDLIRYPVHVRWTLMPANVHGITSW